MLMVSEDEFNMQLCIPCNWDYKLIKSLSGLSYTVYGKLGIDDVGGGRPACKVPLPTRKFAQDFIKQVRRKGLDFNYLLNASCLGNREFTKNGYRLINKLLEWVENSGANYVTVAIPYLAELIKSRFPKLKIVVSKMAFVSNAHQAKFWEDLGVSEITLDPNITRNFQRLGQIRKAIKAGLTLLVNESCLYHCPYVYYHVNSDSHASQSKNVNGYICYSRLFCERVFMTEPEQIIKSMFVRPEDLHFYEEIGIRKFKIVGRDRPTEWILKVIKAYSKRSYDGNLADILGTFSRHNNIPEEELHLLKLNEVSGSLNTFEKLRRTNLLRPKIYINNKALSNFISFFRGFNCENSSCQECGYCEKYAKKAVFIDKKEQRLVAENLKRGMKWLRDGKINLAID